ncbi:YraN family protein, partial [Francisella tularensis subsp. holarctica]
RINYIYLQHNPQYQDYQCRFDLIAINESNINWIKNAFGVI